MTNFTLLLLDAGLMEVARRRTGQDCERMSGALARLCAEADAALQQNFRSVMDKKLVPPSGDKHDYMSVGPYWWPNPDTPGGLPYIHRDGQINDDYYALDGGAIREMVADVETLGLAYFFTREKHYAAHAARMLRVWFIDEATRMNPHLNFAQGVPGRSSGRCFGIIDTSFLPMMLDGARMLNGSSSWNSGDVEALRSWMREYLAWLLNSEFGKEEATQPNNHGTWYAVTVVTLALFTGEHEVAKRVLCEIGNELIAVQIEPDGRQPHELKRTRGLTYSIWNLLGLFQLATLAERFDMDLWHFETADGRSLRRALDWLSPYADPNSQWPYQEITPDAYRHYLWMMLRRAAMIYNQARYEGILESLPHEIIAAERFQLLYPLAISSEKTVE